MRTWCPRPLDDGAGHFVDISRENVLYCSSYPPVRQVDWGFFLSMKKIQVTQEGFENLQKELKELVDFKRPAVLDRLAKARAMGDLRENSEYSASKEEQGFIEGRIMELEQLLKNVEIVTASGQAGTIEIGTAVVVDTPNGTDTFYIVGEFEADPMNKKLSQTSPIGKALIGKKVGDTVEVEVPAGKLTYKIIEVKHT